MSGPNTTLVGNGQNDVSVTRYSSGIAFRFQTAGSLPLLPLPPDFNNYGFNKSRKTFGSKDTVFLPDVDKILNEYTAQRLEVLFTIKFVELINQQYFLLDFSLINDKLEYAVNFYFRTCNLPMISSDEVRKTLSFYFNKSSDPIIPVVILKQTSLIKLINSLAPLETTFFDRIKKVNYTYQKQLVPVGDDSAKWFINFANTTIEKDLVSYFINIKARLIQNLPDAVVNDPRFRASLEDARWDEYDAAIQAETAFYNTKFNNVAGYKPLDWRIVKAMVWTEILAGPKGNPTQWTKYPLQIGRFRKDDGAGVVKTGAENSDLITSPELRQQLKANVTGKDNIRAGIAYLYTIAIKGRVEWQEKIDNPQTESYVILNTDRTGLDGIAKKIGTTSDNIAKNSGITKTAILQPGQTLKYQKAHLERRIQSWNDWLATVKAYNGGGDPSYMDKFNRAYQIITSRSVK